jgi:hypothetical protein
MKKIITVQNPDTQDTSAIFLGETLETMDLILSKPDMNRDLGWINCIHDEIIDQKFQVVSPIVKDISPIELKHHNIYRNDHKNYSFNDYMFEVLVDVRDDVADHFENTVSIESMLGEKEQCTEIVDLEKYVTNGMMMPRLDEVMEQNGVRKLVFRFRATDYIGWESIGYCIYNIDTKEMQFYISPIEFMLALGNEKYGYAGMVHALECMTERDVLNEDAKEGIRRATEKRISEFGDKAAYDSRIDDAFTL